MASFYDNASIITIPSGYKAGTLYSAKPTDGTGDLAFTRTGDTATRVKSDGLIERCITNFALQSEVFSNASWIKGAVTISDNVANNPLTGTATADKIVVDNTLNTHSIVQSLTIAANYYSFSIYAKADGYNFVRLRFGNNGITFNLTDGTQTDITTGYVGTAISLGSGWYRLTLSGSALLNDSIRIAVYETSTIANWTGNGTGGVLIYGAQAQLGDLATNYIATTTAAITQGPITNLPRLDYLGSTCPQLLMEPTRTNLMTYSQMFDNAIWSKVSSASVSGNTIVSPDGYTNADIVIGGGSSTTTRVQQNFTAVSGTTYAFSLFTKQSPDNPPTSIRLLSNASANLAAININFSGGVPTLTTTGLALNAKAENYGNGWYRISGTYVAPVSETNRFAYYGDTIGLNRSSYVWGAQVEAGAYATSYIPCTAATVTRNVDQATKTGITSLLGQDQGTLYHDFERIGLNVSSADSPYFGITGGSATRLIIYYNGSQVVVNFRVNSVIVYSKAITTTETRIKIAIAYKLNDLAVYMNGQLIETNALSADFTTYNINRFDYNAGSVGVNNQFQGRSNQALVFKTRLTNAELATLTTL